ncbi:XRE family transcriptional regulator [Asticcacaulis sp.]|uniref:XRE family transcriptional regulator n=1 Tax=Asticcacaulis sp. TaxID=1872648 RepID=UPI00261E890B|nr:XRE family transcriptional regulator [Asticcacaulis sp.]
MSEALVNPENLRWARERAGLPLEALAKKMVTKPETVLAWEEGSERLTFRQAEQYANAVHVPFGYLFLPVPPEEVLPIPDLRTLGDGPRPRFSLDFMDLLRDVLQKQAWYREHLIEIGAGRKVFVSRFGMNSPTEVVAADIRNTLRIAPAQRSTQTPEEYVTELSEASEAAGIWVMRTGYVGANTHRTFSVEEFRGFAIVDDYAPLVLINGRDAKAAQVFTLAHELAHIWVGQSGVSNPGLNTPQSFDIERFCNAIAAEVLVPTGEMIPIWIQTEPVESNASRLSRIFKVSRIVVARRALDLSLITSESFFAFYQMEVRRWQSMKQSGGGDYYLNMPVKNGKQFTKAVINSAMSGNLLMREAGALLHMKPAQVKDLYRRQIGEAS